MQIGEADAPNDSPALIKPQPVKSTEHLIQHPPPPTMMSATRAMLFNSSMNVLLVCVPFTFLSQGLKWPNSLTFIFSLIAICPLAERLGFVTEQLAMHTNDTIGGLLNVTFGNATELIVALSALFKGYYRVVQLTLLGSILSNMLLVLGCAFFFGGMKFREQKYQKITAQVNMTLLMLSVMGLLFPTILRNSIELSQTGDLGFSRCTCIMLLLMYLTYLYFQLFSHRFLYEGPSEQSSLGQTQDIETNLLQTEAGRNEAASPNNNNDVPPNTSSDVKYVRTDVEEQHPDDEEEEEEDVLGFKNALFWLAIVTVLISFLSDALVGTIESAAKSWNVSSVFLSSIVIPIVGNAAEHAGAVIFARKNKCDLAISIAVGSSTQIALMVLPLLVIISWIGALHLTLDFQPFEAVTLFLTVVTVTFVIMDGSSNYLVGAALITAYIIISAGFFAHKDENLDG